MLLFRTVQLLRSIIGQPRAIAALTQALTVGRLHHAYLFDGPDGVGKRTTALAVAQTLNCAVGGCVSCDSCTKIAHRSHPDVILFEMTPKGLSERVREFIATLGFAPHEGRARVVLFDGAQDLAAGRAEAANILLKTLEEPPPNTHLFLITSEAKRLPVTVRSRCQTIRFCALRDEAIVAWLVGAGHSVAAAEQAAQRAQGSLGRAIEAIDRVEETAARRGQVAALVQAARGGEARALFDAAAEVPDRDAAMALCEELWLQLHNGLLAHTGAAAWRSSLAQAAEREAMFSGWSVQDFLSAIQMVDRVIAALQGNAPGALSLEHLGLQIGAYAQYAQAKQLSDLHTGGLPQQAPPVTRNPPAETP